MNIIECTESSLRAKMDKAAFEINVCVQNQNSEDVPDKFLKSIATYQNAASQLEVLQNIKSQLLKEKSSDNEATTETEFTEPHED